MSTYPLPPDLLQSSSETGHPPLLRYNSPKCSRVVEGPSAHLPRDRPRKAFSRCTSTHRQHCENSLPQLDQPNGKQVVATLSKGDVVKGLTGQVISTPIAAKADRDIPDTPIKAGDTFYVLHYEGEGYWKIWFQGKTTSADLSVMEVPYPKAEWWVKIMDSHGNIGWALSQKNFAHQDGCG